MVSKKTVFAALCQCVKDILKKTVLLLRSWGKAKLYLSVMRVISTSSVVHKYAEAITVISADKFGTNHHSHSSVHINIE